MTPRGIALTTAVLGGTAVAFGLWLDPGHALAAYLCGWLFVLGLTLGALTQEYVHALTGGRWFTLVRTPLSAASTSIWLVMLLFVPLLALGFVRGGLWWQPAHQAPGPRFWFDPHALLLRSVAYLTLWFLLAIGWRHLHARIRNGTAATSRLQVFAAVSLIFYGLSMSLAAYDWLAILQPGWYSSGFGLLVMSAQPLGAMALAIAAAAHSHKGRHAGAARRERFNDLGNLLLMYAMLWAYLAFVQLLIIWSEDLPREISWYVPRLQTSWRWLGLALLLLHFALPMPILLFRAVKRSAQAIGTLAAVVVAANLLNYLWLVLPSLRHDGLSLHAADGCAIAGVVLLWFAGWRASLSRSGVLAHG